MEDSDVILKKLCCTCLSKDRNLFQLCRIPDGINNLYLLLSYDSEAYREGFYKDSASLHICWECRAIMRRIIKFRKQACNAQRQLTSITDGQTDIDTLNTCLSTLICTNSSTYQTFISTRDNTTDNFIDCGLTDIKSESEEDIPLSKLYNWPDSETIDNEFTNKVELDDEILFKIPKKVKYKKKVKGKDCFSTVIMSDTELDSIRNNMRKEAIFLEASFKCNSCIIGFQNKTDFDEHNNLHIEKPNHVQCDVCQVYTLQSIYSDHRVRHYHKYECQLCVYTAFNIEEIILHVKSEHGVKNGEKRKNVVKTKEVLKRGSKSRSNSTTMDKRKIIGCVCTECDKYFDNKNQRWKHIQIYHREGYKCLTCDKKFAFKSNLLRHEILHKPISREECPICHKMIRQDLLKVHSAIHTDRQKYSCIECSKNFISRASYEHHLKYTKAHACTDILKYKCSVCDKGYRSQGELRDHVNYQHMGKTQHKCPICGKALATRRCITRHVRRAHDGVKESARDKICQQCGKAFRDKKCLREHELIHTGERPLSCEVCGCTFRQSASLYTHKKRVHKMYPTTKTVTLLE